MKLKCPFSPSDCWIEQCTCKKVWSSKLAEQPSDDKIEFIKWQWSILKALHEHGEENKREKGRKKNH